MALKLIALIGAFAFAFALTLVVGRAYREAAARMPPDAPPEARTMAAVVAALHPLREGQVLTYGDIGPRAIDAADVSASMVRSGDVATLVNRRIAFSLPEGVPIRLSMLEPESTDELAEQSCADAMLDSPLVVPPIYETGLHPVRQQVVERK